MKHLNILKSSLITSIFFVITGCTCTSQHKLNFDIHSPGNEQGNNWVRLEGLPTFTPALHSDGCSGGMSDTYEKLTVFHAKHGDTLPWRSCCVTHDEAYYYGGSKYEKMNADEILKKCVNDNQGGNAFGFMLGNIMQGAVTPGGLPYFPTSYRWGYGEGYRANKDEVK